jgi:acetylornithine deacetylase/succinyl-diaminopimelate desuccinylase-like protein
MVVGHVGNTGPLAVYGHYDVQPVDPIDLWDHDPVTPFIERGRQRKLFVARFAMTTRPVDDVGRPAAPGSR